MDQLAAQTISGISGAALTSESLVKLTVPQLKAICKEMKLSAYSKLQKTAIIQKILDFNKRVLPNSDASSGTLHGNNLNPTSVATVAPADKTNVPTLHHLGNDSAQGAPAHSPFTSHATREKSNMSSSLAIYSHVSPFSLARRTSIALKRKSCMSPLESNGLRKDKKSRETPHLSQRHPGLSVMRNAEQKQNGSQLASLATEPGPVLPDRSMTPGTPGNLYSLTPHVQPHLKGLGKKIRRFIPLVIKKAETPIISQEDIHTRRPHSIRNSYASVSSCLVDLDFALPPLLTLLPVSMPPSLSQRKRVMRFSVAFSLVSLKDLYTITQCSRLFRYAVYISAAQRLTQNFLGRRFTSMIKQYPPNTTNMWPYLRARQEEYTSRQSVFRSSFLGKVFAGKKVISSRLWASPDNAKQATIAVRFLLTRLFFQISVGLGIEVMQIVDAQEVVEGEIWRIETCSSCGKENFFVLEATCEVIGSTLRSDGDIEVRSLTPLRADWSAYINQSLSRSKNIRRPSLHERLKWTNHEEYYGGISRLWLARTYTEGEIGAAKQLVAERYVLACVVSNSISGRWMSSTEMAQESNGLPSVLQHTREDPIINLFLPAHHLVESLHFTSSDQKPLHYAVAVVQTPGRVYFILRDNGMQVGCEEDGVAEVWMRTLGCDAGGRVAAQ